MTEDDVQKLIDRAIRKHEIRVGWISGMFGILFLFGIIHSIWLMRNWVL